MTIQEVINELEKIPYNKRDLPLYVCDIDRYADNYEVRSVSLYDLDDEHNENNMLALNYTD